MPIIHAIPHIYFHKMEYGGRLRSAVGYINGNDGNKYKARCEVLIFNDKNEVMTCLVPNKSWKHQLAGGTVELDYNDYLNSPPVMDLLNYIAQSEVYEEAGVIVKNLQFRYVYRTYKYEDTGDNKWAKTMHDNGLDVVGDITFMYTAEYIGPYTSKVEECDLDPEMRKGSKFYNYNDVKKYFTPEQKQVAEEYLDKKIKSSSVENLSIY